MAEPIDSESAAPPEVEIEAAAPGEAAAGVLLDVEIAAPAPPGEPAPAEPPAVAALEKQVEQLRAELEESFSRARDTQARLKEEHDRLLRTAAEFENFKKRSAREKDDIARFGVERMLRDFLPVADNLERALDHADQHDLKMVIEGVRLVQKMLEQAFARHGLAGFSALGKPFDPTLHEALMQIDSDLPAGTVASEMARGYRLHDRLVRPAAVVVARPRAPAPEAAAGAAAATAPPAEPESAPEAGSAPEQAPSSERESTPRPDREPEPRA